MRLPLREDRTHVKVARRVRGRDFQSLRPTRPFGRSRAWLNARIVIALAAANRDPERWDDPNDFRIGRAKIREHHGPAGNRAIEYEPSYIIRGLADLHAKLS